METIVVQHAFRGIATILLNRVDRGNAINAVMRSELSRQLSDAAADARVRVLVIRGAGRNFCTGADMAPPRDGAVLPQPDVPLLQLFEQLDAFPKPVIAAIQGACVGAGIALAACCDAVIAAEDASFSVPEGRLGFFPSGNLPLFVRAFGYRNFRRYALSGETINAQDALRMGLVHHIHDALAFDEIIAQIADQCLKSEPHAIAAFKEAAAKFAPALTDAERNELEEAFRKARQSPAVAEGLSALRERRTPNWYVADKGAANVDDVVLDRRRIDLHHHFLPPQLLAAARERMDSSASTPLTTAMLEWSVDRSLEAMEKGGIATAVLSMSATIWSGDKEDSRNRARLCNEFAAQVVRDHKGRFGLFATLPLPDVEGSLREIDYAFGTLKADGIGLMTNYDGKWPGEPAFAPVFDELNRRGATVFFHPHAANCCVNLLPGVPDSVLEYPFDTTRAVTSLLYNGTLTRCPNIEFIFTHGGGSLPQLADRIAGLAVRRKDLQELVPFGPMAAFRKLNFDIVTVSNPGAMESLRKLVPTSRLLYGSDFPFLPPRFTNSGIEKLAFGDADLRAIERNNALRLLPSLVRSAALRV